jgi:hypothetical protein
MRTALCAITKRLAGKEMLDFALSLPDVPFVAKDLKITAKQINLLKVLDLIKEQGRVETWGGLIWKTTERYGEWKAYHTLKWFTPEKVLNYIIDPTVPASNFLVDGYEAIMGHPEYGKAK